MYNKEDMTFDMDLIKERVKQLSPKIIMIEEGISKEYGQCFADLTFTPDDLKKQCDSLILANHNTFSRMSAMASFYYLISKHSKGSLATKLDRIDEIEAIAMREMKISFDKARQMTIRSIKSAPSTGTIQ